VNTQNLVLALDSNLQAEIGGKDVQLELLDRQERAIAARDVDALAEATCALQKELQREIERATKRAGIIANLARALGIEGHVRVGTIAAALGARGESLASRRLELRAKCATSVRKTRHLGALVRGHASLVEEALGRFLSPDPSGAPLGRGSLVDAEA
jgi:hypothetical protein